MKRNILSVLAIAALAFTACDSADQLSGPGRSNDYSVTTNDYSPITNSGTVSSSGSAIITSSGGVVTAGGHYLVVSAGAVSQPTLFQISVVGSNAHVKLQAFQGNKWRQEIHTFSAAVTLTLSYANYFSGDASRLKIAYLIDGTETGRLEYVTSTVDTVNRTVTATLPHFSDYSVVTN